METATTEIDPPGRAVCAVGLVGLLDAAPPLNAHAPAPTPEVAVELKWDEGILENRVDAGRIDGSLGRGH